MDMENSESSSSILNERSTRDNLLREIIPSSSSNPRPARRGSSNTTEMNPAILNEADAEATTESVVVQHTGNEEQQPPTPSTSSAAAAAATDRQNLDIVLLSRHIDHMQQICRASLSDLAVTRQRRQIVRLQSIRRMLEDLQRQIRSLRAASIEELNRRTREAESLSSALGSSVVAAARGRRLTTNNNNNSEPIPSTSSSSVALTRQRATAALCRLRRPSGRSSTGASSSSLMTPTSNPGASSSTSTAASTGLRSSRARLTRAHTQLVSQLRATFRAMEMSPDLARTRNSAASRSKAEASQAVMEETEATSNVGGVVIPEDASISTRNELRALSQRLERMLRDRREAADDNLLHQRHHHEEEDDDNDNDHLHSSRRSSLLRELDSIPRPDANPDYGHRWRHLLVGTPDYDRYYGPRVLGSRGSSGRGLGGRDLHPSDISLYLDSSSESDSESSDHSGDPFIGLGGGGASAMLHHHHHHHQQGRMSQAGRWTRYDFPSPAAAEFSSSAAAIAGPSSSSSGLSPLRRPMSDSRNSRESWRASMRERLDIRAGLRRDAERERRRMSRERDISRRRRRYERFLGDLDVLAYPARDVYGDPGGPPNFDNPVASSSAGADGARLPPLRELIWRRLRRRNAQLNLLDDEIGAEAVGGGGGGQQQQQQRDRSRHREMLSWMVDQLTIDQQQQQQQQQQQSGRGEQQQSTTAGGSSQQQQQQQQRHIMPSEAVQLRQRYLILRDVDGNAAAAAAAAAAAGGGNGGGGIGMAPYQRDNFFLHHTPSNMLLTHRIQSWDFVRGDIPDIGDATTNVVVREAKIHNDASVDISEDGTILVTLVPSNLPMTTVVGVYSLARQNRGTCYATYSLESSAVSVSLSPTTRHLLVGLTTRTARISLSPADRSLMAQVFRIKMPWEWNGERGRLIHRRDIPQAEHGQTALNCIRWIPVAGQGIVYATNTGLLKILR